MDQQLEEGPTTKTKVVEFFWIRPRIIQQLFNSTYSTAMASSCNTNTYDSLKIYVHNITSYNVLNVANKKHKMNCFMHVHVRELLLSRNK
mmetsp:Transcript_46665/g.52691  ORF Transcript_46665/g.52691 Transcript_46665/m.52691 type:complete len:90 (+) Transcript_46665:1135-1404(+)